MVLKRNGWAERGFVDSGQEFVEREVTMDVRY
jgi:hypothetical protein